MKIKLIIKNLIIKIIINKDKNQEVKIDIAEKTKIIKITKTKINHKDMIVEEIKIIRFKIIEKIITIKIMKTISDQIIILIIIKKMIIIHKKK